MSVPSYQRIGKPRKWNQVRHVVDPDALDYYVNRKLKDHDYVKEMTKEDILSQMPELEMHTEPRLHQLQCFYLTTYYRSFLLYMDMGAGKTKVILDTIVYRKKYHGMRSVLVLTLNLPSAKTWVDECRKHAPNLKIRILKGTGEDRNRIIEGTDADIYVTNYQSLLLMLCDHMAPHGKRTTKWLEKAKYLRRFIPKIDTLVIDEGHMISNCNSKLWKLANRIGKRCRFRYMLTGTPFGRDPTPLFGEFLMIDNGETFNETIGMFHAAFYDWKQGFFGGKWVFNKKTEPLLKRMVRNRAIAFENVEFADMPEVVSQTISVEQTPRMQRVYATLVEELLRYRGSKLLENQFVNLRQCTSGYQTVWDKAKNERQHELQLLGLEKKTRSYIDLGINPKLDALEGLLMSLPPGAKFIVFAEYRHTVEMIGELLKKLKIKHVLLYGGTRDSIAALEQFYENKSVLGLVANNVSGSMSINPQHVCHYAIFYETSVRPIIRQQAEKRLDRPGQKNIVFIYDIVVRNSVDDKIRQWLREGKDMLEAIIRDGPQRNLF